MFSLISLKYFYAATEEMNFTRAAKKLYISQQALSNHISKLEEFYGVKLFDRGNPLTLTDAGRALQRRARTILQSVDDFGREVQDIKNFRQGDLTIGIPVTRGTIMLPPLLSAFHQLYPQIRLHLVEGTMSGKIVDALYDGTADLYIGYQPENTEPLTITPLFEEKFVLLVPNRLLRENFTAQELAQLGPGPLSIRQFDRLPFVAQDAETTNGRVFQELCRQEKVTPNIVVHSQNLFTMASLCFEEIGACILPLTFLFPDGNGGSKQSAVLFSQEGLKRMSLFLLSSSQPSPFQISVCRLKGKLLTRAGQEFIHLAREIYGESAVGRTLTQFRFGYFQ